MMVPAIAEADAEPSVIRTPTDFVLNSATTQPTMKIALSKAHSRMGRMNCGGIMGMSPSEMQKVKWTAVSGGCCSFRLLLKRVQTRAFEGEAGILGLFKSDR